MKNNHCQISQQSSWYRLHYCGTCKSLGRLYGKRSRLLLNRDIVFLSEILSLLDQSQINSWSSALHSQDCFELPKKEELPTSLQYAADINGLLAMLKVADNAADDSAYLWQLVQKGFQQPFSQIESRVQKWGIDLDQLLDWQLEDQALEQQATSDAPMDQLLDHYAHPSAQMTGYLFAKGVAAIQQIQLQTIIHQIGYAFGALTYGLDAWKDQQKDLERGDFNILLLKEAASGQTQEKASVAWIWQQAEKIEQLIAQVPIDEGIQKAIIGRLQINLSAALGEGQATCSPDTGIRYASVPTAIRRLIKLQRQVSAWFNPLRPGRFVISYLVLVFIFFQQQVYGVARLFKDHSDKEIDYWFILGLLSFPLAAYVLGKQVVKNRKRILRKIKRQQRKLMRRLRRAERKAAKGENKKKWWFWALVIIGGLFFLSFLSLMIGGWALIIGGCGGDGISCGGSGDSGCGDGCNCGDGCETNCDCSN